MIELNARRPHCRLHTDRGLIQAAVLNTDPLKIRQVPVETIKTLENVCFEGNQLTGEIQGDLIENIAKPLSLKIYYVGRVFIFQLSD